MLIEELARRAAVSVYNSRLYSERSYIASRLQHSLLPPHLPEVPGMEIAARFRPAGEANEVGGDFYDIFQTGVGRWAIVIGDVCGKGADAAAVTAIARYTLRAGTMRAGGGPRAGAEAPERGADAAGDARTASAPSAYASLDLGERPSPSSAWPAAGTRCRCCCGPTGSVTPVGEPGTLLGVVADPVLHRRPVELTPATR